MIKKAKKSVAIGLSVALAVTSVNIPVDSASAAAKKAKLSATKKTLTAGKSTTLTLKTNKKKAKTIKTIKAKYVKVSTSKKSVATVKKVSKKSKVTGIKVTAKKAGKATITVKVTKGTYKGTYKCKVTVKKKASATKKPTQKPTEVPATEAPATEAPATEAPATAVPSTSPAIATTTPTAVPSTSPAIATTTPAAISYNVIKASNITKDGGIFKVNLSFDSIAKADDLKDTVLTLTGAKTVKAKFAALDADGKAVYEITDAADIKALTPFDTTSNGTYKVTSDAKVLVLNGITAEYEEALVGNAVYGYVVDDNGYKPVANAVVKIDGGQSVTTNADGFYKIASVNGQKKMEVSAPDYLDNNNNGDRVYVNRNHVTSQNFVMTKFDQKQVYANITVKDKETKSEISGATVYLYKGNDKDPVVKLDSNGNIVSQTGYGQVCYANENASINSFTNSTKVKADAGKTYLEKGVTYTVKVEKKLSDTNLDDVYMMQTVGTFTVGNKYDNSQEFYANKVKKTPSMTLTQALADADVLDQVAIAGSSASEKAMKVNYDVYTNIYGGDGLTKLTTATKTIAQSADIKNNKVDVEITGDVFGKKGTATLPTGDYFVVVDPQEAPGKDTDSVRVAIAAVKIHVTEGEAAKGNVTITKGFLREFVTNVALTPEQEKAQGAITAGTALNVIEKKTSGYDKVTPDVPVKVDYDIKQIVDGVKVPIVAKATDNAVTANAKNTFVATNEYNRLLSTGEYAITSKGNYVEPVEKTESINNKSNMTLTYNTNGAWNMVQAAVKVGKNNKFIDATAPADFALTKVVAKNVATGKETTIYDAGTGAGLDAKCGTDITSATAAISSSNPVAEGNYLVYDLSNVAKQNLSEGKYTFTYSFKAYKNAVAEYSAIGLENVKASAENTFVKSTNDKTTVTGVISTKSDAGVVAKLNGETGNGSNQYKALVMLLNNKNQIAGLSKVSADGEYTITDGIEANVVAGGAYKLVIRAFGYETKVVDVTVDANKELTENVTLEQGGKGEIKAYVSDTNKNVISDIADSYAFDKYAIVQPTMTFVADLKKVTHNIDLSTDEYDIGVYKGAYNGTVNGKILTFSNLSAGDYTVSCGSTVKSTTTAATKGNEYVFKNTYSFKNELVTIKNNGDKMYPEWQYAKAGDTSGSDLVKLSILFSSDAKAAVANTGDVFAITVTDKEGNLVPVTYKDNADKEIKDAKTVIRNGLTTAESSASSMDILVPSASTEATVTYTVTLYTKSGKQVATALVPVQRVNTSVAMTVNNAIVD